MKYGKNPSGASQWRCNPCSMMITPGFLVRKNRRGKFNPDLRGYKHKESVPFVKKNSPCIVICTQNSGHIDYR